MAKKVKVFGNLLGTRYYQLDDSSSRVGYILHQEASVKMVQTPLLTAIAFSLYYTYSSSLNITLVVLLARLRLLSSLYHYLDL